MVDRLKKALHELWAPSQYTIPVNQGQLVQARLTGGLFMTQDAQTKSPLASALASASQIGIVSPGPPEDLAAVKVYPVVEGDISPITNSSKAIKGRGRKGAADSGTTEITHRSRIVHKGGGDGQIKDIGSGVVACGADSPGLAVTITAEESVETVRQNIRESVVASDVVPRSNGFEDKQPSKRLFTRKDPVSEGGIVTSSKAEGVETVEEADQGAAVRKRRGGKPTGVNENEENEPEADNVPGAPLVFNMGSILRGCRRASRLKRKRDERNASAYSFSGKLSGRASADDQDSKAAARAFSRVLHKVG